MRVFLHSARNLCSTSCGGGALSEDEDEEEGEEETLDAGSSSATRRLNFLLRRRDSVPDRDIFSSMAAFQCTAKTSTTREQKKGLLP